jgi:hypothetical protein
MKDFKKWLLGQMEFQRRAHSIEENTKIEYACYLNKKDLVLAKDFFVNTELATGKPLYKVISQEECLEKNIIVMAFGGGLFTVYFIQGPLTCISVCGGSAF